MNHINTHMLSLDAELQAVDFSTQPRLSGNEAALLPFG